MHTRRSWLLLALVSGIFGTTFLAIKTGLEAGATPFLYAGLRFTIAGSVLLAIAFATRRLSLRGAVAMLPRAALLSSLLTVGTFGCMFVAETRVDSGLMARLDATGPLITALFAAMLLRKRFSLMHGGAFALGTAGTVLIASPASTVDPLFLLVAMGSVVTYAAGNALYPRLFRADEDPVSVSALQTFVGGIILLLVAPLLETPAFPLPALGSLLWLILAGSVVAHTAALVLVRDAGPVFASTWLYIAPGVATFAGMLVLGETITIPGLAGMTLALAGVFVMGRAER